MPTRIGQVLGLVRTLIAYGKNLADTLQQHAARPDVLPFFPFVASIFSTRDVALILARITRGLLRAAALEERLLRHGARGRDLQPTSFRPPAARRPRAAKSAANRRRAHDNPSLFFLPSPEQIAAQVRRSHIGALLVDICLDLGIVPEQMDLDTWDELIRDLFLYRGKLRILLHRRETRFQRELRERRGDPVATLTGEPAYTPALAQPVITFPEWPQKPPPLAGEGWGRGPGPQSPAPASTGPPRTDP